MSQYTACPRKRQIGMTCIENGLNRAIWCRACRNSVLEDFPGVDNPKFLSNHRLPLVNKSQKMSKAFIKRVKASMRRMGMID